MALRTTLVATWCAILALCVYLYQQADKLGRETGGTALGNLIKYRGQVEYRPQDLSTWKSVQKDQLFTDGTLVATGSRSLATIELIDGTKISMASGSQILLESKRNSEGKSDFKITIGKGQVVAETISEKKRKAVRSGDKGKAGPLQPAGIQIISGNSLVTMDTMSGNKISMIKAPSEEAKFQVISGMSQIEDKRTGERGKATTQTHPEKTKVALVIEEDQPKSNSLSFKMAAKPIIRSQSTYETQDNSDSPKTSNIQGNQIHKSNQNNAKRQKLDAPNVALKDASQLLPSATQPAVPANIVKATPSAPEKSAPINPTAAKPSSGQLETKTESQTELVQSPTTPQPSAEDSSNNPTDLTVKTEPSAKDKKAIEPDKKEIAEPTKKSGSKLNISAMQQRIDLPPSRSWVWRPEPLKKGKIPPILIPAVGKDLGSANLILRLSAKDDTLESIIPLQQKMANFEITQEKILSFPIEKSASGVPHRALSLRLGKKGVNGSPDTFSPDVITLQVASLSDIGNAPVALVLGAVGESDQPAWNFQKSPDNLTQGKQTIELESGDLLPDLAPILGQKSEFKVAVLNSHPSGNGVFLTKENSVIARVGGYSPTSPEFKTIAKLLGADGAFKGLKTALFNAAENPAGKKLYIFQSGQKIDIEPSLLHDAAVQQLIRESGSKIFQEPVDEVKID